VRNIHLQQPKIFLQYRPTLPVSKTRIKLQHIVSLCLTTKSTDQFKFMGRKVTAEDQW